jgi:Holliday junction resolvase
MGKASRDKGLRNERQLVNDLKAAGFDASRVPLSGALGGKDVGDVIVSGMRFEAKVRSGSFSLLYRWLSKVDGLFLKSDRQEQLVVMRMRTFKQLLQNANGVHENGTTQNSS